MTDKHRQSQPDKQRHPETEPYAPSQHPDVHVPEQQLEKEDLEKGRKSSKEPRKQH